MSLRQFLIRFELGDPDSILWVDPSRPQERYNVCPSDRSGEGLIAIGKLCELRDIEACKRLAVDLLLLAKPEWVYRGVRFLSAQIQTYWDDPRDVLPPILVARIRRHAAGEKCMLRAREMQVARVLQQIERQCVGVLPQAGNCPVNFELTRHAETGAYRVIARSESSDRDG